MYTIKKDMSNEIIIKYSKFIAYIYKVKTIEDINNHLYILQEKYKDATHICYGYIINNIKKCNNDNEPNNTAGLPILKVLEKNNLNQILAVVIRYFGGIKLGANGLIRAYTRSITELIKNDTIVEIESGFNADLYLNYKNLKQVEYILKNNNSNINIKDYNEQIRYNVDINKRTNELLNNIGVTVIINNEIYIEKAID